MKGPQGDRKRWILLVLLVLSLAAALRLIGLGQRPLWYDEIAHIEYASQFWGGILSGKAVVAEPFFLACMAVWRWGLRSEVGLRLPAVMMGCAGALAGLHLGHRLAGFRGAAGGGIAAAAAPMLVYYGRDAKMYAWVACFELVLAGLALAHAQGRRGKGLSAAFILTAIVLVYTHLASPLYLAALGMAYLVFFARSLRQTLHWLGLQLFVLAGMVPWVLLLWRGYTSLGATRYWIPPPTPDSVLVFARNAVVCYAAAGWVQQGAYVFLGIGLVVAVVFCKRRPLLFIVATAVLQAALFYAVSHAGPRAYFLDRYLIGSAALLAAAIGAGIAAIPWRIPRFLATAAALFLAAGSLYGMAQLDLSPRVRDHLGVYRPVDAFALRGEIEAHGQPGQPIWHTEWHALVQARWYLPQHEHVLVDMGGRLAHDLAATAKPSVEEAALSAPVEIERASRGQGVVWLAMPRHLRQRLGYADGIRAWVQARAALDPAIWPGRPGYAPLRLERASFRGPVHTAPHGAACLRTGKGAGAWLAERPPYAALQLHASVSAAGAPQAWLEIKSKTPEPLAVEVLAWPGVHLIPAAAFDRASPESPWRLQPFRDRTTARMAYHAWVRPGEDPGPLSANAGLAPGRYALWLHRLAQGNGIPAAAAWRIFLGETVYSLPAKDSANEGWTHSLAGQWSHAGGEVAVRLEAFCAPNQAEACAATAFLVFAPIASGEDPVQAAHPSPFRARLKPGGSFSRSWRLPAERPWLDVLAAAPTGSVLLSAVAEPVS